MVALIFCLLLLPATALAHQSLVLPIVFEDYPPYEYVEDGEVKGINMDLIREAFKRMDVDPFFEPRPWKRALYELENGDIMALSSGFKTEKRQEFAYFPEDGGLATETNCVVILSVSGLEVTSLEDLRGLRVGVVREYLYGEPFDTMKGLTKIEANSSHQLLQMLLNQRMDAAIGNKTVFRHLAKKMGKAGLIQYVYELGSEPLYLMFSKAHGQKSADLARDFGKAIRAMKKDGTFDAIHSKY